MEKRIHRLGRAIQKAGGVDIVVTHAPPMGLGDLDDPAHRGFEAFLKLIDRYHPKYLLHGHTHLSYRAGTVREVMRGETEIINVSERYVIDYPSGQTAQDDLTRITRHKA